MIKKVLFAIVMLTAAFAFDSEARADSTPGDWRLHGTFESFFKKTVDTPKRTFFQLLGQGYWDWADCFNAEYPYLFVYDKESEEMLCYNKRNYLSDNMPINIAYNATKGYLLLVYTNGNIDLLFDDNTVRNIPGYMSAILSIDKKINSITFDAASDRVYLATKFGYIVLNDKKYEIAESHDYGTEIVSICRVGNQLVLSTPSEVRVSPISGRHMSLSEFKPIGVSGSGQLTPLSDTKMLMTTPKPQLIEFAADGSVKQQTQLNANNVGDVSQNKGGYCLRFDWVCGQLDTEGNLKLVSLPEENRNLPVSSWDFNEFWFIKHPDGMASMKYDNNTWSVTRNYAAPNAPSLHAAYTISHHDNYGMVLSMDGASIMRNTVYISYPMRCSTYKNSEWIHYGNPFCKNPLIEGLREIHGPVFDPADKKTAYIGTFGHGLMKMNFDNQDQVECYSHKDDNLKNNEGFHVVFEKPVWQSRVSKPSFDADGTLWCAYGTQAANVLWYWPKDARLANNTAEFKSVPVPGYTSHYNVMTALRHPANKNIVMLANGEWDSQIAFIDHRGTLDNPSDDRVKVYRAIYDQDGSTINKTYTNTLYEDVSTGKVWVCTSEGVFTVDPSKAFDSDFRASRIKVARNDGTNLADYLLDGITVYNMAVDGAGRKWFATASGAVLTSADGSEVYRQLTTDNSYLPDNVVLGVGCDPNSNSVWFGTNSGIAEYFSDATPAEDNYDNIKSYPNPVRPDYLGLVTIEGLMDNSLVKIVDASGNLIKDLGRSSGGMITWDITNLDNRRVKTGVYYILASQTEQGQGGAKISKIMVVN